mmetsp:Transcript_37097/g.55327  ORF Transcript_37097/g.55327 Transcript_37097/m.55327 type:complete len:125 (+) Transcript_37097:67-441(+)
MGRNAKIVRTTAFEKQKRHEKGGDWRRSAKVELRENDKKRKEEQKVQAAEEKKGGNKAGNSKTTGPDMKAALASAFISLDQMASGDIDMGLMGSADNGSKAAKAAAAGGAGKKGKKAGKTVSFA